MSLRARGELRQGFALTPELRQSLEILSMGTLELGAFVRTALMENPLLDLDEREDGEASPESSGDERDGLGESGDDRWDWMRGAFAEAVPREDLWRDEPTLLTRLHEQIDREPMNASIRAVAHAIVDSLDDDGYFRESPEVLAKAMGQDPGIVERVLEEVVQRLDPPGIGARDLVECLLLQLDVRDPVDALCRRALVHAREALREEDDRLVEVLGCTREEVARVRARLRRLDPWPGHGLRGQPALYVRPEIVFRRTSTGDIEVELADLEWRRLRIAERWTRTSWQGEDAHFVREARREAQQLLRALDQRARTMLAVGRVLARRQRAFLDIGVLGLRPLTIQDVAREIGVHESTVSRITSGKYARTPIGVVELRRFFASGLPTHGGEAVSVHRVRQRIRMLIESEPPSRPVSDQAIANRLQAEGIAIARRTVAKYREQMGIPPSSVRRRRAQKATKRR